LNPPASLGVAAPAHGSIRSFIRFVGQNFNKGPFLALHFAVVLVLFVPVTWTALGLCVGLYYLRMFGVSAGFHRYFAHRSYKTSRVFQFAMACLGCSALQKGPLWWAANHRQHHKHSDQEEDPHSPVRHGLWWSHIGWVLSTKNNDQVDLDEVKDFSKYWELRLLERFHWAPAVVLAALCYLIDGWSGVVWGGIVSTVLLYHGTFLVNSICHLLGYRRYQTTDESRNNWWVALLTMGEGWHNNHHYYMSSVRQGFKWWEIDMSFYVLKLLSLPRVVWGLRGVPRTKLAAC
jgi:stearoyl-CoA desaturase (Delta-9 desaturase)